MAFNGEFSLAGEGNWQETVVIESQENVLVIDCDVSWDFQVAFSGNVELDHLSLRLVENVIDGIIIKSLRKGFLASICKRAHQRGENVGQESNIVQLHLIKDIVYLGESHALSIDASSDGILSVEVNSQAEAFFWDVVSVLFGDLVQIKGGLNTDFDGFELGRDSSDEITNCIILFLVE